MRDRKTGRDSRTGALTRRDALLYAGGALVTAGLDRPVDASAAHDSSRGRTEHDCTVASYYFGNYHPNDARNRKLKGDGWSEWELGWDPSPRADQSQPYGNFGYPFANTLSGNTPARFREALGLTKERVLAEKTRPRVVTIECWNEWTEGSYLEPDAVHGFQYLEAVRAVFPPRAVGAA